MRRHVQCMRRIGRNRGVRARRLEAQLGQRRIIDAVNDVVRHARMVLMACQQPVENLAALLLPRIRLVRRVEVADRHQLQSVENRGLVVAGVAIADPAQSLFVILRPGHVIDRLPVLVEHREGLYVVALAAGLRVNGQEPDREPPRPASVHPATVAPISGDTRSARRPSRPWRRTGRLSRHR